ncbi:carboxypeptidase regulatory-like domain-containing protein [Candidatus Poribacteria bacterium]|nr:carboxypeptidase regulatory-like domain-containing protein [Candidatus Poribacteria bacterium]
MKSALVIAINVETKDKYKAFTDSNGYYEIPDLPAGTYLVLCIKTGYKAGIKKVDVPSGVPTEVDFKLTPSLE